jgi:hypothetical protein
MTAFEGGVIDARFLSIPGATSTVEKSTMLETVWIGKDTFQFRRLHDIRLVIDNRSIRCL